MAEIFNEQRKLGVVIVVDGTTMYNGLPVIGIAEQAEGVLFANNQRTLGVEIMSGGETIWNDQPVRGAVLIEDGRTIYNGAIVAPSSGGGHVFANAEAAALVSRFSVPPINTRKALIDTLVGSLKTAGIWSKLDAFYVMAAADSQAAKLNWIANQYNLTEVNAPVFTVDRGFAGDGATSYLDTGFTPSGGGNLTQNSSHVAAWVNTDIATNATAVGAASLGTQIRIDPCRADGNIATTQSDATLLAAVVGTSVGFTIGIRTAANARSIRRNNAQIAADTQASISLPTSPIMLLQRGNGALFNTQRIAVACFGSSLTSTESDDLYNAIGTYLVVIGAAAP